MNLRTFMLTLGLFALSAAAQNKPSQPSELPTGSVLRVLLSETVGVENCKAGDQVTLRVLGLVDGGKLMRPRNPLTLVGHITEVQVRAAGQPESRLGIAFDKMGVRNLTDAPGREFSVKAVIKRVVKVEYREQHFASSVPTSGDDPVQRAAGPMVDNMGRPVYSNPPTSQPGPGAGSPVGSTSYDANIKDFSVHADNATSVTVISSKKRNIALGPETPMLVQVTSSGEANTH